MKSKKIMSSVGVALSIVLMSSFPCFAQENILNDDNQNNNIATMVSEVGDSQTIISEVLTFDEIVQKIAKDNNITLSESARQVESNFSTEPGLKKQSMVARAATYRTITNTFEVDSTYKPSVEFYCQTDEWQGSSFRSIEKILNIDMNRNYRGISKGFDGTVYANLEAPNKIYWIVNGNFYNNATTTVNGGVDIKLGENSTVKFGISNTSNFFKYAYKKGYAYL
ncbi:hypothetical protein [Clostridium sp. Marseille-Q7071]